MKTLIGEDAKTKTILSLSADSVSIEDLSLLNGCVFQVRKERSEWGEMVVCVDKAVVTNVKASINLSQGKIDIGLIHIYADFYLNGNFIYNAWVGLDSMKDLIAKARGE